MTQNNWRHEQWAHRMTALHQAERTALTSAVRAILAHRDHITDALESGLTILLESLDGKQPRKPHSSRD